jgi:hypothetical protein
MSINARRAEEADKAELEERRNRSTNMNSAWSEIESRREAEYLHSKCENEKQQSLFANQNMRM